LPERQAHALVHLSPHDGAGHRIVLIYPGGEAEDWPGSLVDACELAGHHGLTVVLASEESIRWERHPETWRREVDS